MTRDTIQRQVWRAAIYFGALMACMGFGIWACSRPPYSWNHVNARLTDLERVARRGETDRDRRQAAVLLMQQAVRAIVAIRGTQMPINFDDVEVLLNRIRKELR